VWEYPVSSKRSGISINQQIVVAKAGTPTQLQTDEGRWWTRRNKKCGFSGGTWKVRGTMDCGNVLITIVVWGLLLLMPLATVLVVYMARHFPEAWK
jgi:hypothetical protein